jgi:hypothetical protein
MLICTGHCTFIVLQVASTTLSMGPRAADYSIKDFDRGHWRSMKIVQKFGLSGLITHSECAVPPKSMFERRGWRGLESCV